MSLEEILMCILSNLGPPAFLAWASRILQVEALRHTAPTADRNQTIDNLLDHCGIKPRWKSARNALTGETSCTRNRRKAVSELAAIFRIVGVPLGVFHGVPEPWSDFLPGSKVVVMFGAQQYQPVTVKGKPRGTVKHQFSSLDDARACTMLREMLDALGLQVRLELVPVPMDLPREDVDRFLHKYRNNPAVNAVVIIGSPVVNAAADRAAEIATGGKSVAKFRFLHDVATYAPYLCEPAVTSKDQGIRVVGWNERDFIAAAKQERGQSWEERVVSVRYSKQEIAESLASRRSDGFRDCGVVIVDDTERCLLLLAIGHGGEATCAAVSAIADTLHFSRQLASGEGRAFEIVDVEVESIDDSPQNLFITRWELPNRDDEVEAEDS